MTRAFTQSTGLSSRLLLVGITFVVAGCATTKVEAPHYPWPDREAPLPPIVVRTTDVMSETGEAAAAANAVGTAGRGLLLSGMYFFMVPVGPLATLVGIPLSFMEARNEYSSAMGGRCPDKVRERLGDVPKWVQSTFGGARLGDVVAEGARSRVRDGGPRITVLQATGSAEERLVQLEKTGKDHGAPVLILADVSVLFRDVPGGGDCDVKLLGQAQVRVQPIGQPEMKKPRYSVWAERPQVPLEEWATDPERARVQLRELLLTLGRNLVESYSDRMGCFQRPCEWDASERPPLNRAPLWCLLDPNAAAVRCDFREYESCVAARPGSEYGCVESGPY